MNYPDFLNADNNNNTKHIASNDASKGSPPGANTTTATTTAKVTPSNNSNVNTNRNDGPVRFNDILFNGLSPLDEIQPVDGVSNPNARNYYNCFDNNFRPKRDSFNLPLELQGGVNNISSRRPSYAAESFTRNINYPPFATPLSLHQSPDEILEQQPVNASPNSSKFFNTNKSGSYSNQVPMINPFSNTQYQYDQFNENFANLNINTNFNNFQTSRPSQLVDYPYNSVYLNPPQQQQQQQPPTMNVNTGGFMPIPENSEQSTQQPRQQTAPQNQQPQTLSQQAQQQDQQLQSPASAVPPPVQQQQSPGTQKINLPPGSTNYPIRLENGLILKDKYIIASSDRLKPLYIKTTKYFQDPAITSEILTKLNTLLMNPTIIKLVTFIKNLNNLTFNHKILCLVVNKNGKFDLLSYPNNSNILLQKNDLVISDGDRGKDLVMIVEPLVNLDFAILFNFLKKVEHLKSLTIQDIKGGNNVGNRGGNQTSKNNGGTHSTSLNASTIITSHSNEDNEFIITLPTKQVLRFATPGEVHKISGKFLEEKKAFITCYNKIKEVNLESNLTLINVEYQSDLKKLIFYYFAGFKRIDFRGLIKELFKIYKTRIWLCAVLPYDKPETYITMKKSESQSSSSDISSSQHIIPQEYELTNEQILNFSINEFDNLASPNYFHSINLLNLITHLNNELDGYFYGFNTTKKPQQQQQPTSQPQPQQQQQQSQPQQQSGSRESSSAESDRSKIVPKFNPFGDS
ncbi:Uncharacterized protein JA1_003117 [Spathaspora sp. JA1]|nr:Uncharacterized protein JA1_003117 [Spathaspora sp. JA1]